MKLRTLIVDLDCAYGINHFNLVPCDECLATNEKVNTLIATPFVQDSSHTFQWTTNDTADYTVTYSGGSSTTAAHFDHLHVTPNGGDITIAWNTSIA